MFVLVYFIPQRISDRVRIIHKLVNCFAYKQEMVVLVLSFIIFIKCLNLRIGVRRKDL